MRKFYLILFILVVLLMINIFICAVSGAEAAKISAAGLKFIESNANDKELADIQNIIKKYEQGYVEAVNKGDFKIVEPYITPGSSFYTQQKKVVSSLFKQKTKEKLIKYTLERTEYLTGKYKAYVVEEIEISTPGKEKKVNEYVWIYDINKTSKGLKIGAIAKWTDYKKYIEIASGRVKTDGFYVDDFGNYYSYLITDAINSLYIGRLKEISNTDSILEKQKKLITDMRGYGTGFELLEYKNLDCNFDENKLTGTSVNEYVFKYKSNGIRQSMINIKIKFDLEEVRIGYSGYAKIVDMQIISLSSIDIPTEGKILQSFIPKGWKVLKKIDGDLNKDNLVDITAVIEEDKEWIDQEYTNAPERLLLILTKQKDNSYKLSSITGRSILRANEGGVFGDPFEGISIKNGVLAIAFYGGSNYRWGYTYKFRYQNGGWYLIGATLYNCYIGNGEYTTEDFNLLTGKEIITKGIEGGKSTIRNVNRGKKALVNLKDFVAATELF